MNPIIYQLGNNHTEEKVAKTFEQNTLNFSPSGIYSRIKRIAKKSRIKRIAKKC